MKKHYLYFAAFLALALVRAPLAHADSTADLTVTPAVIDEKGKQRDILKENVTVKNMTSHVLQLYPSIDDINTENGDQSFQVSSIGGENDASLASWVELSRGMIQLSPGEERSVPFIIQVNLNAKPGDYHAQIKFTAGDTRAIADSNAPLGTVTVNFEVQADVHELLQLNKFSTSNLYLSGDDVLFNYELENTGNQELDPQGQIRIYDRRGQEVASVPVNKQDKTLLPNQQTELASAWSAAQSFGRYKAMIDVNYGSSQTASVQDTVFFWIIPWKELIIVFVVSLIAIVGLALYFHKWLEQRHFYKFANAGLLNSDTLEEIHTHEIMEVHPSLPLQLAKKKRTLWKRRDKKEHLQDALLFEESHQSKSRLSHAMPPTETPSHAHGHSIDLKQIRAQQPHHRQSPEAHQTPALPHSEHSAHVEGHVISLKKRQ